MLCPRLQKWAIQEYALPSDLSPILASLRAGSARAISDGSFKDKFGTSAFTILNAHDCCILGLNIVPGHPDDQGAYRSELAGLFGIVLVVNLLCVRGPASLRAVSKLAAMDSLPLTKLSKHGPLNQQTLTSTCLALFAR
jgi:hypothetical protein